MALTDKLTAIGDAIREKEGSTGLIALSDMPSRIQALSSGDGDDPVRKSVLDIMSGRGSYFNFVIPAGAKEIPEGMFSNWQNIGAITYEDDSQITKIGQNAFMNCGNIQMDRLPSGFADNQITYMCFKGAGSVSLSKGLPEGITVISTSAFEDCWNLQLTTLPSTVTEIMNNAFRYAYSEYAPNLPEMLTLPAGLQTIGQNAFYGVGLKKIRFLGTPTDINRYAFSSSPAITDIYVPWMQTTTVGAVAPWGATNATIHYEVSPDEVIS